MRKRLAAVAVAVASSVAVACSQLLGLTDPQVQDGAPDAQTDTPLPPGDDGPAGDAKPDASADARFCTDAHTLCDDFDDGQDPSFRWTLNNVGGEGGLTDAQVSSPPLAYGCVWDATAPLDSSTKGAVSLSHTFTDAGAKTLSVQMDFLLEEHDDQFSVLRIDSTGYWEVSFGFDVDLATWGVFVQDVTQTNHTDQGTFAVALQTDRWFRLAMTLDFGALTYAFTLLDMATGEVRASAAAAPIYAPGADLQTNFGAKFFEYDRGAMYLDNVVVDLTK